MSATGWAIIVDGAPKGGSRAMARPPAVTLRDWYSGARMIRTMIKRSEAAAAVRPGPAVPFRLTALVVSAVHTPGPVRRAGAAASFRLRIAGPVGPFRVSLDW
jgi:hypothetical protein